MHDPDDGSDMGVYVKLARRHMDLDMAYPSVDLYGNLLGLKQIVGYRQRNLGLIGPGPTFVVSKDSNNTMSSA